ncbi:MAG: hypothetical protein QXQ81_06055 [Candidatus Thorarchaeota archaeon]
MFACVRRHSRDLMNTILMRGYVECPSVADRLVFSAFKFDEVRGNLILGFLKQNLV